MASSFLNTSHRPTSVSTRFQSADHSCATHTSFLPPSKHIYTPATYENPQICMHNPPRLSISTRLPPTKTHRYACTTHPV